MNSEVAKKNNVTWFNGYVTARIVKRSTAIRAQ